MIVIFVVLSPWLAQANQAATQKRTCQGVAPWETSAQASWCNANCNNEPPHCPASHCSCTDDQKAPCSNFSNQWVVSDGSHSRKDGKYINIVQTGCSVLATNGEERWSPGSGVVVGNRLYMVGGIGSGVPAWGTLNGNSISWSDGYDTVWKVAEALPLEEGLKLVRSMLQSAIEIEQTVIQPYLSALYSINAGSNSNATSVLHDLVVEEMLHMTTAANILNAVGGHPQMNTQAFVPVYPMTLPFVGESLDIAPFSQKQMSIFRLIEEGTWGPDNDFSPRVHTAGVYYFRIGMNLEMLVKTYGEKAVYSGDPSLQVEAGSSRGKTLGISNHADAMQSLQGVYQQGEGSQGSLYETSPFNGQTELPHYYRFNEVYHNRCYQGSDNGTWHMNSPTGSSMGIDWNAVHKFVANPRARDFKDHTTIYQQMLQFNSCYTHLLAGLHDVFNGSPFKYWGQVGKMVQLGTLAKTLIATAHPEYSGMTVGPSWEWVDITGPGAIPCSDAMLANDMTVV